MYLSCDKRELVLAQVAEHAGAELFHTTAAVRLRGSAAHRARLHTQPASNLVYAALLAKLRCAHAPSTGTVFNFTQHHSQVIKNIYRHRTFRFSETIVYNSIVPFRKI
jgi:hypothetical protein